MYGNWRHNIIIAGAGSILIFLVALSNNLFLISLLRGIYSFIAFLIIVYVMRFVIGTFIFPKEHNNTNGNEQATETNGQTIDYVAQDEDENLQDLLKQQLTQSFSNQNHKQSDQVAQNVESTEFKPLKPTQLFTNKSVQPEEMSKAIRHLTGE